MRDQPCPWVALQASAEPQLPAAPVTVQPRWPGSTRPIWNAVSPATCKAVMIEGASLLETITAIPIPQLNVRAISSAAIDPPRCSSEKTEGKDQFAVSITAWQLSGITLGIFSIIPPPVICASA